jgi:hypothetical protein
MTEWERIKMYFFYVFAIENIIVAVLTTGLLWGSTVAVFRLATVTINNSHLLNIAYKVSTHCGFLFALPVLGSMLLLYKIDKTWITHLPFVTRKK